MGIWQRKMDRALVNIQKTRILNEAQDFTLRCQRKALLGKKREIVLEWEIDKKTGKRKKKISLVLCEKKEQIQETLFEVEDKLLNKRKLDYTKVKKSDVSLLITIADHLVEIYGGGYIKPLHLFWLPFP